jgi:hypothetical protein
MCAVVSGGGGSAIYWRAIETGGPRTYGLYINLARSSQTHFLARVNRLVNEGTRCCGLWIVDCGGLRMSTMLSPAS